MANHDPAASAPEGQGRLDEPSALNGVPSWNFTRLRSVKVQVNPFLDVVQPVARSGTMFIFVSNRTKKLFIIRPIASPGLLSVLAGSRLSGSAPAA